LSLYTIQYNTADLPRLSFKENKFDIIIHVTGVKKCDFRFS